jgi:predicted nucleic acid-binding protein
VIVVDASALLPLVVDLPSATPAVLAMMDELDDEPAAPYLVDVEVAQVLRRLVREGELSEHAAAQAIDDLVELRLERYPHQALLPRIWALRANLTAYDAAYLALAEALDAPLITRDRAFLTVSSEARILLAV